MQRYYDDLWDRLPDTLVVPDLSHRTAFLRTAVRAGDRALDLGCGDGTFTAELARAGASAIGADVVAEAVRRAAARHPELEFRHIALEGPLPFADGGFDVVWTSEVIEHVGDTGPWLSEVRRVLAPRGRLLLTTPDHGRLRLLTGGIERYSEPLGDHLHLYSRRSLRRLLEEFGFAEIVIRAAGGPPMMRRVLLARAVR